MVLDHEELRKEILDEVHEAEYSVCPEETKMYHDQAPVLIEEDEKAHCLLCFSLYTLLVSQV